MLESFSEDKTVKNLFKNIPEGTKFSWKTKKEMVGRC
jgi:hypothetical protein